MTTVLERDELITDNARPGAIRTVLLATDLTRASDVATDQAIEIAGSLGARLLVVHVIDVGRPGGGPIAPYERVVRIDQRKTPLESALLSIVQRARARHTEAEFLLWTGEPGQSVVAAAEAEGADLIVVGTRGLDASGQFLLGSISNYVVYHSSCPVLVAH